MNLYHGSPYKFEILKPECYLTDDYEIAVAFGAKGQQLIYLYQFECNIDKDVLYDGKEEGEDYWRFQSQVPLIPINIKQINL